jgi:hypothetical protein
MQLECTAELAAGLASWAHDAGIRAVLNPAPARPLPPEAAGLRHFGAYPVDAVDTTGAGAFCVTRNGVIDGLGYPADPVALGSQASVPNCAAGPSAAGPSAAGPSKAAVS